MPAAGSARVETIVADLAVLVAAGDIIQVTIFRGSLPHFKFSAFFLSRLMFYFQLF